VADGARASSAIVFISAHKTQPIRGGSVADRIVQALVGYETGFLPDGSSRWSLHATYRALSTTRSTSPLERCAGDHYAVCVGAPWRSRESEPIAGDTQV